MIQKREIDPNDLFNKGNEYFDNGSYEQAINEYIKVMQNYGENYQYFCERGIHFAQLGKDESAIDNFISQSNIITRQNLAQYLRGSSCRFMQKNEDAIQDFTQILQQCPLFKFCYYDRGNLLYALGRKEEAIKDYTKAIEIDPKYSGAYYNRGFVLYSLGKKEEAINDYSKAIEIDPKYSDAYYNRAFVLYSLGKKEEAINDYSKAIEIYPKNSEAYYNRGIVLNQLGRKEEAINDYTKAIEIDLKKSEAYYNRGFVLDSLGINEEAYKDYLLAYQLQPQNPLYNIQLGRSLLVNGEKEKAYEFLSQGLNLTSTLSQENKQKYNLSEGNIKYIQKQTELIQQIEEEITKVYQLIKSKTLSENEQNILQEKIKPIEAQFKQQNNKPIDKDDNAENNMIYQQLLNQIKILTEKVFKLENQRHQIIIQEMIELKKDDNRYIYYQSLYWRLYNYISACQQLSTDLFKKNTDAVIDNDKERVAQIIGKVVQQISNQAGSIPIVGTVVTIISSALEFAFSYHLDYKFNSIVRKLTHIVQERCVSGIDKDEEIQLAIIKQSKQLRELTNDQQLKEQGLLNHVEQIQDAERDRGNLQAYKQYWKQGVVDTLKILRNLLLNYKYIQLDTKKELHIVILDSLKEDESQFNNQQVVRVSGSWCERCSNSCTIQ